jgi:uncharacterized protein (TIGR02246 family)
MSQADIEAVERKFMDGVAAGDAAAVAALYTENARLMPPNSELAEGKAAIQAVFQAFVDMGAKSLKLEVGELHEFGDTAVELGTYQLELEPPGAGTITDLGKFIVMWRREGGVWKLDADIWNSNLPAPS